MVQGNACLNAPAKRKCVRSGEGLIEGERIHGGYRAGVRARRAARKRGRTASSIPRRPLRRWFQVLVVIGPPPRSTAEGTISTTPARLLHRWCAAFHADEESRPWLQGAERVARRPARCVRRQRPHRHPPCFGEDRLPPLAELVFPAVARLLPSPAPAPRDGGAGRSSVPFPAPYPTSTSDLSPKSHPFNAQRMLTDVGTYRRIRLRGSDKQSESFVELHAPGGFVSARIPSAVLDKVQSPRWWSPTRKADAGTGCRESVLGGWRPARLATEATPRRRLSDPAPMKNRGNDPAQPNYRGAGNALLLKNSNWTTGRKPHLNEGAQRRKKGRWAVPPDPARPGRRP